MLILLAAAWPAFANGNAPNVGRAELVKVIKKREGNLLRFFVENLQPVDITATFDVGLVNLKGNTKFPCTLCFPPHQVREAFALSPLQEDADWTYTLTNHYTLGSCLAVHDDAVVYALPYAEGQGFRVSQAFDGSFSHSGPEKYAIDWSMPEGTPVLAARSGLVVATKDDSKKGGPKRMFENDANYVLIRHADGTIGNYAHLSYHGAKVKPGDLIKTGDVIALSGNTGFSSGPHLHFSVFRPKDGRTRESILVKFRTDEAQQTILSAGRTYFNSKALLLTTQVVKGGR